MHVEADLSSCHNIHMKRTNLVLDETLLNEATAASGAKTYSKAVTIALEEALRRRRMLGVLRHFGEGLWEGDLKEMREDDRRRTR